MFSNLVGILLPFQILFVSLYVFSHLGCLLLCNHVSFTDAKMCKIEPKILMSIRQEDW